MLLLKTPLFKIFALIVITIFATIPTSHAQEACGQVIDMNEMGEPEEYCSNLHERRLEYRKQRIEFREKLDDRREKFIAPQLETSKNYEKALADLNKERSEKNDVASR